MPTISDIIGPRPENKPRTITSILGQKPRSKDTAPKERTIRDIIGEKPAEKPSQAQEQPGFSIPLLEGEVRDEDGRPGTLLPTTVIKSGGRQFEVIGSIEDFNKRNDDNIFDFIFGKDTRTRAEKSGITVIKKGKGKFRPRRVALDKEGDVDFSETAKEAGRGIVHGIAEFGQFFIDAPQVAFRALTFQGPKRSLEAFTDKGTLTTLAEGLVQKPTTGLGDFVQLLAVLVPGTGATRTSIKGVMRFTDRGVKATKRLAFPEKVINDVQDSAVLNIARGEKPGDAMVIGMAESGVTPGQYAELVQKTGLKPTLPATKEAAAAIVKASDMLLMESRGAVTTQLAKIFQPAYDRVRDLSPKLFGKLREMEFRTRAMEEQFLNEAEPLFVATKALSRKDRELLKGALINGDFDTARALVGSDVIDTWVALSNRNYELMKSLYGDKVPPKVENYFPRIVEDKRGLLNAVGRREASFIRTALKEAADRAKRQLTQVEESNVINGALFRRKDAQIAAPTYAHARKLKKVPDFLKPFYADPILAGHLHLRKLSKDLNLRQMLRRSLRTSKKGNVKVDDSIGALLLEDKALSARPWAAQEVKEILKARFEMGEVPPNRFVQMLRNITYSGTLGNIFAALTQLQDFGMAASRYGFIDAIRSLGPSGAKRVFAADVAVTKAAEELLQSPVRSARVMERILKVSGFNKFDRMGKSVILTGAYRKLLKQAASDAGQGKIMAKWGPIYGRREAANLIQELQTGKITDRIRAHLFNELADVQPISLGEVPLSYLKHPNGRFFYTLNTFAIRQLAVVLREARNDWRKGNAKGAKTLARYMIVMGTAGLSVDTVKDMLKGRPIRIEDVPLNFGNQILRNYLTSGWMARQAGEKGVGTAIVDRVVPPAIDMVDAISKDMVNLAKGDPSAKSIKFAPFINPLYWWVGPGLDQIARQERKRSKGKRGLLIK